MLVNLRQFVGTWSAHSRAIYHPNRRFHSFPISMLYIQSCPDLYAMLLVILCCFIIGVTALRYAAE